MKVKPSLKIALACDWLTTPGGAEKVLLELHHMYPDAPIYTSQYSKKGINWFDDAQVHTGWLQIFPKSFRKFLGPLRQLYFSHLDLSDYDLVISVTGAEAKAIRTKHKNPTHSLPSLYHTKLKKSIVESANAPTGATHLCYCHVPTQYYWQMYDRYVANPGFGPLNPLVRFFFKLLVKPLRKSDYQAAQQPDQFITISNYAKEQIKKYYDREAVIVAPPVEITKFLPQDEFSTELSTKFSTTNQQFSTKSHQKSTKNQPISTTNTHKSTTFPQEIHQKSTLSPQVKPQTLTSDQIFPAFKYQAQSPDQPPQITYPLPRRYFIIACRQVTWKRVDLAIQACLKISQPLLVVGDGPERKDLLKLAGDSPLIRFIPWAKTEELAQYLQGARGYIFPSLEPFGIAAVEALAAGCPVIAYAEGGSRDFIQDRKNGLLFKHQTVSSLAEALQEFQTLDFDRTKVAQSAHNFSQDDFRQGITALVEQFSRNKHISKPTLLSDHLNSKQKGHHENSH